MQITVLISRPFVMHWTRIRERALFGLLSLAIVVCSLYTERENAWNSIPNATTTWVWMKTCGNLIYSVFRVKLARDDSEADASLSCWLAWWVSCVGRMKIVYLMNFKHPSDSYKFTCDPIPTKITVLRTSFRDEIPTELYSVTSLIDRQYLRTSHMGTLTMYSMCGSLEHWYTSGNTINLLRL